MLSNAFAATAVVSTMIEGGFMLGLPDEYDLNRPAFRGLSAMMATTMVSAVRGWKTAGVTGLAVGLAVAAANEAYDLTVRKNAEITGYRS